MTVTEWVHGEYYIWIGDHRMKRVWNHCVRRLLLFVYVFVLLKCMYLCNGLLISVFSDLTVPFSFIYFWIWNGSIFHYFYLFFENMFISCISVFSFYFIDVFINLIIEWKVIVHRWLNWKKANYMKQLYPLFFTTLFMLVLYICIYPSVYLSINIHTYIYLLFSFRNQRLNKTSRG